MAFNLAAIWKNRDKLSDDDRQQILNMLPITSNNDAIESTTAFKPVPQIVPYIESETYKTQQALSKVPSISGIMNGQLSTPYSAPSAPYSPALVASSPSPTFSQQSKSDLSKMAVKPMNLQSVQNQQAQKTAQAFESMPALRGAEGFSEGFTNIIPENLQPPLMQRNAQALQIAQQNQPMGTFSPENIGGFAGNVAQMALAGGGLKGLTQGGIETVPKIADELNTIKNPVLRNAVTAHAINTAYQLPGVVAGDVAQNKNLSQTMQDVGKQQAESALFGAGIAGLGGIANTFRKYRAQKLLEQNAAQSAKSAIPEAEPVINSSVNSSPKENTVLALPEHKNVFYADADGNISNNLNKLNLDTVHEVPNYEPVPRQNYNQIISKNLSNELDDMVAPLDINSTQIPAAKSDIINHAIDFSEGNIGPEDIDKFYNNFYKNSAQVEIPLSDEIKNAQEYLKGIKVYKGSDITPENGFSNKEGTGNRAYFGKQIYLSNNGNLLGTDQYYKEANSLFPNLFPDSIVNPADQMERFYQVASIKPDTVNAIDLYPNHRESFYDNFSKILDEVDALNEHNNNAETFAANQEATSQISPDYSLAKGKRYVMQPNDVSASNLPSEPVSAAPSNISGSQSEKLANGINSGVSGVDGLQYEAVGAKSPEFNYQEKTSNVLNNTIKNTSSLSDAEKSALNDNADAFKYQYRSEANTQKEAAQRMQIDPEGELNDLLDRAKSNKDGADADVAFNLLQRESQKAAQTGDYTAARRIGSALADDASKAGQFSQAFAKYTRTPEGAVVKGISDVEGAAKNILKKNHNLNARVTSEESGVKANINRAQKSAAEQTGKEFSGKVPPEQRLADRISNALKPAKQPNPIDDMIKELYNVAKESPLPERETIKRSPIDFLSDAIQNKGKYADIWNKAKEIVQSKYSDNPSTLQMLDDYIRKGIDPAYSSVTLNSSVKQGMNDLGQKLSEIAVSNAGDKKGFLGQLTQYITEKTGAQGADAESLAQNIQNRFDQLVKEKSNQLLKNMFKEVPITKKKDIFENIQKLINLGAYDDASIRDLIYAKNGLPRLTNEDIKAINENMIKAESQTDRYQKLVYQAKAHQIIADRMPTTARTKFLALRRIPMLLNSTTMLKNPLGNSFYGAIENVRENTIGALADTIVSKKTGIRTTKFMPVSRMVNQFKGGIQGASDWARDIANRVDTSPTLHEMPMQRVFKNPVLNFLDETVKRGLQLGDRPYSESAYESRLKELQKLGYDTSKPEIDQWARDYAKERVFQNDSNISKSAMSVRRSLGPLGDIAIPFVQTPSNMFDKMLDYSPYGYVRAIKQWGKIGNGAFDQKIFVDKISRALTGTGMIALGYALASKGILTGQLNTNKAISSAQKKSGQNAYSLNIDGKTYTYDWTGVPGILLGAAADAYAAGASKTDILGQITAGAEGFGNAFLNQSFVQGLNDLFGGYNASQSILNTVTNSPLQFVPTVSGRITRIVDPYQRETYDPNTAKQYLNQFTSRIPGLSQTLQPKIDTNGKPMMQYQGRDIPSRIAEASISPGYYGQDQQTPVEKELMRIYQSTGNSSQFPTKISATIKKNGKSYTLTPEQYTQYQEIYGQTAMKLLSNAMGTSYYKQLKDEDKAKALSSTVQNALNSAKSQMIQKIGGK